MFPTIGPLKLYTVIYILSMIAHFPIAQFWCRRMALPRRAGLWLSTFYFFGMAVGARILYDFIQHQFDFHNYLRLGYYFEYGLWGGPLAYLMLAASFAMFHHHRRRDLLDLMVLSLPLPMVLAKVACFLNGCCYGLPCDWPWCIAFPPGADAPPGIPRHATQAYEILVVLVIWLVVVRLRHRWAGLLTLWFIMLYGLGRPLTEIFREPDLRRPSAGLLTTSQLVCLAGAMVAGIGILLLRPPTKNSQTSDRSPANYS